MSRTTVTICGHRPEPEAPLPAPEPAAAPAPDKTNKTVKTEKGDKS